MAKPATYTPEQTESIRKTAVERWLGLYPECATPRSVDWPAVLRRITCPALLITADLARGAILAEEGAAALRALVPQLQIAHIPGAGHNIRREQFARFMEVVRAFLAEHTKAAR